MCAAWLYMYMPHRVRQQQTRSDIAARLHCSYPAPGKLCLSIFIRPVGDYKKPLLQKMLTFTKEWTGMIQTRQMQSIFLNSNVPCISQSKTSTQISKWTTFSCLWVHQAYEYITPRACIKPIRKIQTWCGTSLCSKSSLKRTFEWHNCKNKSSLRETAKQLTSYCPVSNYMHRNKTSKMTVSSKTVSLSSSLRVWNILT